MGSSFLEWVAVTVIALVLIILSLFAKAWLEKDNEPFMPEIRDKLNWFHSYMAEKLLENRHKRHWSTLSVFACLNMMDHEIRELQEAIDANLDEEEVRKECADVANYALFIADNYKQDMSKKLRSNK